MRQDDLQPLLGDAGSLGFLTQEEGKETHRSLPPEHALEEARLRRIDEAHAYEKRRKDYFRTDIKIGYTVNRKKSTHEFSIDLDNVFNTKNIWQEHFDSKSGNTITEYQIGFFPIPQYRITF